MKPSKAFEVHKSRHDTWPPFVAFIVFLLVFGLLFVVVPVSFLMLSSYWLYEFLILSIWLFAPPYLAFVVARWTYWGLKTRSQKNFARVLWLRRFDHERKRKFKVSKVIDRLSRLGISTVTLQDTSVRLSAEQLLSLHGRGVVLTFIFFAPVALTIAVVTTNWRLDQFPENIPTVLQERYDGLDLLGWVLGRWSMAIFLSIALSLFVVFLYNQLRLMRRAESHDPAIFQGDILAAKERTDRVGSVVLRVPDDGDKWRQVVRELLSVVDAAIIDVTKVTPSIEWELGEASRVLGSDSIVYISSNTNEDDLAVFGSNVIGYDVEPKRKRRAKRLLTQQLSNEIYTICDRKYNEKSRAAKINVTQESHA